MALTDSRLTASDGTYSTLRTVIRPRCVPSTTVPRCVHVSVPRSATVTVHGMHWCSSVNHALLPVRWLLAPLSTCPQADTRYGVAAVVGVTDCHSHGVLRRGLRFPLLSQLRVQRPARLDDVALAVAVCAVPSPTALCVDCR